ncbi:MAG: hypothetical protein WCY58_00190 [Mariniphaga sp.]|nr:hypothetical protein [Mariniphaga sp.]MDD4226940.1 hypothetical protein [Mariniphaga sp.]
MDKKSFTRLKVLFTFLNIVVGWHILYEGFVKLIDPSWTSASYLVNASGFLEGIFQSIAESPLLLQVTDIINILVLTLAGLFIFIGLFTRYAALSAALLIGLYYLANPPVVSTGAGFGIEGNSLIVNKNLIEIAILILIAFIPKNWYYGVENLLKFELKKKLPGKVVVPDEMNHFGKDDPALSRRAIVKNLISLPFLGGFAFLAAKNHGWKSFEEENFLASNLASDGTTSPTIKITDTVNLNQLIKPVPKGRLGGLEVGRIICGGNLISGFAHSRDLIYVSRLLKTYFNEKKVMDTFWICEECGINTTAISAKPNEVKILNNYWKQGGKIQWIAPTYPSEANYKENIDFALDHGASAIIIMGNVGDEWARSGKFELMAKTIDYIKSKGVSAGVAGHEIETIKGAEEHQVGADFYMKTLHSRNYWSWKPEQAKDKMIIDNYSIDNYWDRNPDETISYMETLDKPWIAFKVLAAGAVHPKNGFRFAFEKGADFACVGMFDYQIVENANLLTEMFNSKDFSRSRMWA